MRFSMRIPRAEVHPDLHVGLDRPRVALDRPGRRPLQAEVRPVPKGHLRILHPLPLEDQEPRLGIRGIYIYIIYL